MTAKEIIALKIPGKEDRRLWGAWLTTANQQSRSWTLTDAEIRRYHSNEVVEVPISEVEGMVGFDQARCIVSAGLQRGQYLGPTNPPAKQ